MSDKKKFVQISVVVRDDDSTPVLFALTDNGEIWSAKVSVPSGNVIGKWKKTPPPLGIA